MPTDAYQMLSRREQRETLDEVSRRTGIASAIVEKDYWVCRTLDVLFTLPELSGHLLFKGGTTLSKVYRLIERFSEDIDVSFHRDFLGYEPDGDPEEPGISGKRQQVRIEALKEKCFHAVQHVMLPALQAVLTEELNGGASWSVRVAPDDPQTIYFHYPQAGAVSLGYIEPLVRIELGARSDSWPSEQHSIRSLIGESLGQPIGIATVDVLSAERTFWEKATLLHAEYHRDPKTPMPLRYARHYHDLVRLASSPVGESALQNVELRKRVVAHKSVYFRSGWARYDLAVPGTFRLAPPESRARELMADNESMREMFFRPPASLDEILEVLAEMERRINALVE